FSYTRSDRLYLLVEDNGSGFDEEQKSKIIAECENKEMSNRIGLHNVYQRLLYYYKGDVDIIMESKPCRTVIGFSVPMRR
ncbi:MAG: hypothetical protein PQJ46_16240, partial [Spirochaetales bacterium]|nr:hypothetical protein [Spirochaetales bacterium]